MKPLKLLHVVPSYLPARRYGGPLYSVHGLCKALASNGHEVHVFTTNVDGPGDSPVPLARPVAMDGVQVWYFPSRWLRRLYWSPSLADALRRQIDGFDLLHLHSVYLWPTWAAARAARRAGVPYCLAPRGMLVKDLVRRKNPYVKAAWIGLIERRNIERATLLHATSQTELDELRAFRFKLPRIAIVPNGVDEPAPLAQQPSGAIAPLLDKQPLLLFLSRISWKKGLDRLIQAMVWLPSAHAVIAGNDEEGYWPGLQALAERCGVTQRLSYIGPVYDADKAHLLSRATLLVLPSYSENFGNVVVEAMAYGCPVVVSEAVGAADLVRKSGAGRVVEGGPEALARALQAMIDDGESRARMGASGRTAVLQQLAWSQIAQRMEAAYRPMLEGHQRD